MADRSQFKGAIFFFLIYCKITYFSITILSKILKIVCIYRERGYRFHRTVLKICDILNRNYYSLVIISFINWLSIQRRRFGCITKLSTQWITSTKKRKKGVPRKNVEYYKKEIYYSLRWRPELIKCIVMEVNNSSEYRWRYARRKRLTCCRPVDFDLKVLKGQNGLNKVVLFWSFGAENYYRCWKNCELWPKDFYVTIAPISFHFHENLFFLRFKMKVLMLFIIIYIFITVSLLYYYYYKS